MTSATPSSSALLRSLHDLTEGVHTALLKNRVFESLNAVVEDADIDALDEEITRVPSPPRPKTKRQPRRLRTRILSCSRSRSSSPSHNPSANTGK